MSRVNLEMIAEDKERCPDCGHWVDSIFDHIDGTCPDDDPPSRFYIGEINT